MPQVPLSVLESEENPMNSLIDLTGQSFGIWTVVEQAARRDNKTRWLCRCSTCGAMVSHRSTALRKGKFARCFGSHKRRPSQPSPLRKDSGWAAATETFGHYRQTARKRGLTFNLSRDEFHLITAQDCHYCGAQPAQRHSRRHFNGAFIYNGIDRKDSDRGYEPDNCLPCCGTCNVMKQDLGYADFLRHIARIYQARTMEPSSGDAPRIALGKGGNWRPANIEQSGTGVNTALVVIEA